MKKVKISLILNILTVVLVAIATIFMFAEIKFMPTDRVLEANKIEMFKYYTVDSNILVGIVALILSIFEIKLLNGRIKKIPEYVYTLKLVGTAAVFLTFMVTAFFLVPKLGLYSLYNNSNLFYHLIVPLLAIISYICFEKYENKYRDAILGIIPMFIYSIYYIGMILTHLDNGNIDSKYEFYGFLNGNIDNIYIVIPIIYLATYVLSLILVKLNKKN